MNTKSIALYVFDKFLHIFHIGFIILVLIGWIFPITKLANIIAIFSALFFWLFIGLFKGLGYCPVIDIHNKVRKAQGKEPFKNRYIKIIIDFFINSNLDDNKVGKITYFGFLVIIIISVFLNLIPHLK